MSIVMTHSRGFTLVELLVSLGLFTIVMTLAAQGYLVMLSANRDVQALGVGINNLSGALEYMTREIREGHSYCGGNGSITPACSSMSGSEMFSFIDTYNKTVTYAHSSNGITRAYDGGAATLLTDSSVDISVLTFYVQGQNPLLSAPSDNIQPQVVITIKGFVSYGSGGKKEKFDIETSATMRGTDL